MASPVLHSKLSLKTAAENRRWNSGRSRSKVRNEPEYPERGEPQPNRYGLP